MKEILSFLITASYTYFFYSSLIYIAIKVQNHPNLYSNDIMWIILLYAILMLVPCLMSFILSAKEIKNWLRVDLLCYFGASVIFALMRSSGDIKETNFYQFFFLFTGLIFFFSTIWVIRIFRNPIREIHTH